MSAAELQRSGPDPRQLATRKRPARPAWFDACILVLALFPIYLLCANYSGQQITDNVSTFTAGWTVGRHGTLDVSMSPEIKPWTVGVGDRLYSDRSPGLLGWTSIFYLALGNADYITTFPAAASASLASALAMGLLYLTFRRLTGPCTAFGAFLLASFGTATWTISADAAWPHGPDQMFLAAMVLACASQRWWLTGVFGAAAVLTRPITAISVAVTGLWMGVSNRDWRIIARIGSTSLLGLLLLITYNRLFFHQWTLAAGSYNLFLDQFAGRGEKYDPTDPVQLLVNATGALFSPTRGVLALSPFLIVLVPGIVSAWRQAPEWVRASAASGLAYAIVQIWGNNFAGGAGFYSYRYTIESLTLLSPLLLLAWTTWVRESRWRRRLFSVLAVASVIQHAIGSLYITPSIKGEFDNWRRYLLVEALQRADAVEISFFITCSLVAILAAIALGRRQAAGDQRATAHSPRIAPTRPG